MVKRANQLLRALSCEKRSNIAEEEFVEEVTELNIPEMKRTASTENLTTDAHGSEVAGMTSRRAERGTLQALVDRKSVLKSKKDGELSPTSSVESMDMNTKSGHEITRDLSRKSGGTGMSKGSSRLTRSKSVPPPLQIPAVDADCPYTRFAVCEEFVPQEGSRTSFLRSRSQKTKKMPPRIHNECVLTYDDVEVTNVLSATRLMVEFAPQLIPEDIFDLMKAGIHVAHSTGTTFEHTWQGEALHAKHFRLREDGTLFRSFGVRLQGCKDLTGDKEDTAKAALEELVLSKKVKLVALASDEHDLAIVDLYLPSMLMSVSEILLRRGIEMYGTDYLVGDEDRLCSAMNVAVTSKAGLYAASD